jgi:hypothetical protein
MTMSIVPATTETAAFSPRRALWPLATLGTMLLLIVVLTARLMTVTLAPSAVQHTAIVAADSISAPHMTVSRMAAITPPVSP